MVAVMHVIDYAEDSWCLVTGGTSCVQTHKLSSSSNHASHQGTGGVFDQRLGARYAPIRLLIPLPSHSYAWSNSVYCEERRYLTTIHTYCEERRYLTTIHTYCEERRYLTTSRYILSYNLSLHTTSRYIQPSSCHIVSYSLSRHSMSRVSHV